MKRALAPPESAVGNGHGFGYDRWAEAYRPLERLVFGGALQRARLAHIDALNSCRHVLALGEGDGRFAAELTRRHPHARVIAVDASSGMIRAARRKLHPHAPVRFLQADLRVFAPQEDSLDAVVGLFVFDQFERHTLERMLPPLVHGLRPGGLWLHADFAVPDAGWRRWRAQAWAALLYRAFGMATELEARRLVPMGPLLQRSGLERIAHSTSLHGMLESSLYRRSGRS